MANGGTALGALNEIIENAGGTSDAQTLVPAIEDLGEIIGSGGGGTIADGSITTAKLADDAVTFRKIDYGAVTTIRSISLVAANSQTDQVLTALGYDHGSSRQRRWQGTTNTQTAHSACAGLATHRLRLRPSPSSLTSRRRPSRSTREATAPRHRASSAWTRAGQSRRTHKESRCK